jgi:FG-GAP-like repeat
VSRRSRGGLSASGARAAAALLACIGVALVLGAVARSAARTAGAAPSFAVAKNYAVGRTPGDVAIADLNGDRRPDVVTTDSLGSVANTVSVLLNRGDGTLGSSVEYRVGLHPQSAKVRDLNGDGKPDIAVVSCNSGRCRVSVRLNRGDGTFAGSQGYSVGGGLTAVDLNGDHRPDLITVISNRAVSVLMNKGDGTFESKVDHRVGDATEVSVGDLNRDGAPDLAVANEKKRTISVFRNTGDGTFLPKRDYLARRHPSWVAIADLNGDGRRDVLAYSCRSGTVSVLLNKGGGHCEARATRA